ncbi:MAG: TIGR02281 family clan AA aspartic protease [Alphaproteobacteria bacterium]
MLTKKTIGFILIIIIALGCGIFLNYSEKYILLPYFVNIAIALLMFFVGFYSVFFLYRQGIIFSVFGWILVAISAYFTYQLYQDFKTVQISGQNQSEPPDYILKKRGLHFYADALVNGTKIHFLVDTGASLVTITRKDALRAGIDVDSIDEYSMFSTANGVIRSPITHIKEIRLGDIIAHDILISISDGELEQNLLGNSFLEHVSRKIEVGNELHLWQ